MRALLPSFPLIAVFFIVIDKNNVFSLAEIENDAKPSLLEMDNDKLTSEDAELQNLQSKENLMNEMKCDDDKEKLDQMENELKECHNKIQQQQQMTSALESLYEKCTSSSQINASKLEKCEVDYAKASEDLSLAQGMLSSLQIQYEEKLVHSSQCSADLDHATNANEEFRVQLQDQSKLVDELSANYTDVQRSYNALKKYKEKRVSELKGEIKELEEEVEKWKGIHKRLNEKYVVLDRRSIEVERELRYLRSIEQPYCNLTLIYEDTTMSANYYANVTMDYIKFYSSMWANAASKKILRYYQATEEFLRKEVLPFINEHTKHTISPVMKKIYGDAIVFYESSIEPHVEIAILKSNEIYNEYAKDWVDEEVLPRYRKHIAPLISRLANKSKSLWRDNKPFIQFVFSQIRKFLFALKLGIISGIEEFSTSSVAYLLELEKQQNIAIPEWIFQILKHLGNEAEMLVHFLAFIVIAPLIFPVLISIVMFPFFCFFGLLFRRRRTASKALHSPRNKVSMEPIRKSQKVKQKFQYPSKVKVEQ